MSSYNFLGLVNDVNRRLNEVELTQNNFSTAVGFYATVKDAVNSTIRQINNEEFEWPFNHVTQEEELNTGEVRYFIPRDVKSLDMDSFRIVRDEDLGNSTVKLKVLSYEEYLDKYLDHEYNTDTTLQGIPQYVFRTPSLEYGVVPSPNKDYRIAYEYYRSPVGLNLYSDVPSVPEEFRYVIVDGAMEYAHNFRGDTQSAQLSAQKFQEGLKSMRSLYINRYEYVRSTVRV
jgi:hypothetical protein